MTDRTSKILLAAIALGLWANAVVSLIKPQAVIAQDSQLSSIDDHLSRIDHDVHNLEDISDGTCTNGKIC
jgi:hypothetical protein